MASHTSALHLKQPEPILTPAKTRVMSSTFIPAKGRLDASPTAVCVDAMLRRETTLSRLHSEVKYGVVSIRLELLDTRFAILKMMLVVKSVYGNDHNKAPRGLSPSRALSRFRGSSLA